MAARDAYYTAIEQSLELGGLDAELFERLAAELVESKGYPTQLVVGGADNGYDFELSDADREPGPGVVTTGAQVLGNLRRNLGRHRERCPRAARKTFVVTSRRLTPQKRRNLMKCAEEKGYVLLGVADQAEVARYIYAHPRWAKDLLHLSGRPSAISLVPRTSRPLVELPLVGRDDALNRLRNGTRDTLLVGRPGSGKTSVLAQLARDELGAFLVDSDPQALAEAIRAQRPAAVFIDDVPSPVDAARDLSRLRTDLAAPFRLVVTAWERDAGIMQSLSLQGDDVVELDRLTRDQMVDVVGAVGVFGPVQLVREILDQAEGVPGLAVELAQAALNGDREKLLHGDLLGSLMIVSVERLTGRGAEGHEALHLLAAAALAGDDGLNAVELANAVGASVSHVASVLRTLEPGGLVLPRGDRVAVRPRPLRRYLIRAAFFSTAPLDYHVVLSLVPHLGHAARELVLAQAAGATVPDLLELVLGSRDVTAARHYAALGRYEAAKLLDAAPQLAVPVAREALRMAPEAALPLLLTAAIGDDRELHSSPDHPLRLLRDWILDGRPGTRDALMRRDVAVRGARVWASNGGDTNVAVRACCEALSLAYESQELDPGAGIKLTLTRGTLTPDEIGRLDPLWAEVLLLLKAAGDLPWPALLSMCHQVAYPVLGSGGSPELTSASHALASSIVRDLGELGRSHPAILDRLNTLKASIGECDRFSVPEDYLVLFGDIDREDFRSDLARRSEELGDLARSWSKEPETAVQRLVFLQSEAAIAGSSHIDNSAALCRRLAETVREPRRWLSALTSSNVGGGCVDPFLERVVLEEGDAWEVLVRPLLDTGAEPAALSAVLRAADVSDELWKAVCQRLCHREGFIETLCLRDEVPEANLSRLLCHECENVRAATAVGMWEGVEHGKIPERLRVAWQSAVVATVSQDYWLREMLPTDSQMAEAWLAQRIQRDDWRAFFEEANVDAAVSVLDSSQRLGLLRRLGDERYDAKLVQSLVGESLEVYSAVLADSNLRRHCDDPLRRTADVTWSAFTKAALQHGVTAEQVAAYSTFRWGVHWGPESAYIESMIGEYEMWLDDTDTGLQRVAQCATQILSQRRSQALEDERQRGIEGLA
jgi:hypothetical protein